jgi:hypothetical protein
MRFTRLGWIVLGFGLLLLGYLFSRGVYVGSITMLNTASGLVVYEKYCHYFSLTGLHNVRVNAALTEEEAKRVYCLPLGN